MENHESYNFYYSTFCVISTVRRTSVGPRPQKQNEKGGPTTRPGGPVEPRPSKLSETFS